MLEVNAHGSVAGDTMTQYVNIVTGSTVFNGTAGNDALTGTAGSDFMSGGAGNDTINTGNGDNRIFGGDGDDSIVAGSGFDVIIGGAGNDTITSGLGADVLQWRFADKGAVGAPASDVVTDFTAASVATGGDALDLRDLLQGENHVVGTGNLGNYLHFEKLGTSTVVHISSAGGYSAGFNSSLDDQKITLNNIDLTTTGNDQAIIQDLLNKGKLIVD
jgi:Ca2+-binding RTX toxin-like protein